MSAAASQPAWGGRRALPAKAAQVRARQLMRQVFAKELEDHSDQARSLLAAKLLEEASKAADQPTDQYVLLCGAYQAAREGGDLELCLRAAEEMAKVFEVEGLSLKLAALPAAAVSTGAKPDRKRAAVTAGLSLVEEAVAGENFAGARAAATVVESAATRSGNRSLLAYAKERLADERLLINESARVQKDVVRIRTHPEDAAANYAVGRFLCFVKGDWQHGLPLLAQSTDPVLHTVAATELAGPVGAARLKLADDWWTIAARQAGLAQYRIERHATSHYQAVVETLGGLEKVRVQRRLAEMLPLTLTSGEQYQWAGETSAIEMIPMSQGICILSGIGGYFGPQQEIGIGVVDGHAWSLAGRAQGACHAHATALISSHADAFKAPVEYEWKTGEQPVRMIRADDGVCVLSGIAGPLRDEGDRVGVHPGDDGYWYLGGRAGPGLTVRALALQAVKAGSYRPLYTEHEWKPTTGVVRLLGKDDGFCFISGVGGKFAGVGEDVHLSVSEDGSWQLDGESKQATVMVRAISVLLMRARP